MRHTCVEQLIHHGDQNKFQSPRLPDKRSPPQAMESPSSIQTYPSYFHPVWFFSKQAALPEGHLLSKYAHGSVRDHFCQERMRCVHGIFLRVMLFSLELLMHDSCVFRQSLPNRTVASPLGHG